MAERNKFTKSGARNPGVMSAVQSLGGVHAAARALGVSHTAVIHWIYRACPAERAVELAKLTGVSAHKMRPDLFEVSK